MMDWDTITQTGARASGVEEMDSSHGGASCAILPDTVAGFKENGAGCTKDIRNVTAGPGMSGARLNRNSVS